MGIPGNNYHPTQQGRRREEWHLGEFNTPSDALDESESVCRLYKALGAQCPQAAQAGVEHLGLDPLFNADFPGRERVVLMRYGFWTCSATLGT